MLLYSKSLELTALYLLTQHEESRGKIMARLEPAHFWFPATNAAYQRFLFVLQQRSVCLDWLTLCEEPALLPEYRDLLKAFESSEDEEPVQLENLLTTLETYRVGRALNELLDEAKKKLTTAFDPEKLIDDIADGLVAARTCTEDQKLYHIGQSNNTTQLVVEILDQSIRAPLIPTGFKTYDHLMGGFPDTGLVILAATTSSGKSTMANQLAININRSGWDVCKVSLEMTEAQEMQRFLANITNISHKRIHNKQLTATEVEDVKQAYREFVLNSKREGKRLTIVAPTEDLSLTQLLMLLKPFNYKVIIIDYITLLKEKERVEQWKHLSEVAREAKRYTLKTGCLIIMLAQLDADNKIRYSRAIQEHCVTGDTLVNVDGKLTYMRDIVPSNLPTNISSWQGESAILNFYRFTTKPTLTFTTSCGYQVTVSATTPVLVSQSESPQFSAYYLPAQEVTMSHRLVLVAGAPFATLLTEEVGVASQLGELAVSAEKVNAAFMQQVLTVVTTQASALAFLEALFAQHTYYHHEIILLKLPKALTPYVQTLLLKLKVVTSATTVSSLNQVLVVQSWSRLKFTQYFPELECQHLNLSAATYLRLCRVDRSDFLRDVPVFTDAVHSITAGNHPVYDFTVTEHNFLANGIVVHNSDVVWMWNLTEADRENNKFTVNQTKGRNQGIASFEVNANFECMRLTDEGGMTVDEDDDGTSTSDITDLMG